MHAISIIAGEILNMPLLYNWDIHYNIICIISSSNDKLIIHLFYFEESIIIT